VVVQRCQYAMNLKQANTLCYQTYSHEKQQKFEEAYKDTTKMLYSLDTIFFFVSGVHSLREVWPWLVNICHSMLIRTFLLE
jgi:hypothetical protein